MKDFENGDRPVVECGFGPHSVNVRIGGYVFSIIACLSDKNKYAVSIVMKHDNASYTETLFRHEFPLTPEEYETVLKYSECGAEDTDNIDFHLAKCISGRIFHTLDTKDMRRQDPDNYPPCLVSDMDDFARWVIRDRTEREHDNNRNTIQHQNTDDI